MPKPEFTKSLSAALFLIGDNQQSELFSPGTGAC